MTGSGPVLLVVSPDYASHLSPLLKIAARWRDEVGAAIVATGPTTRPLVDAAGVGWTQLELGRSSNSGVIELAEQPPGEDEHLRAFFDATRAGPIATLLHQAEARRRDLLHDPDGVFDRLTEIVAEVRPDRVIVDHVAFGARLALHALDVPAVSVVLGHPSALSAPGELYGMPTAWPSAVVPAATELAELRERCRASVAELAEAADEMLSRRAPRRRPIGDLTATGSPAGLPTLFAAPDEWNPAGRPLPAGSVVLGSLTRSEELGDVRLPDGDGPLVVVALGTFLSARDDVLATAVRAAHLGRWRLALAFGSTPVERLGEPPEGALVARHLPQVALLSRADVLVSHGGNGSATEAAAAGVPQVVLPFSTDQFDVAASVERAGIGRALAPNGLSADELVRAVDEARAATVLQRAAEVARRIRSAGGAATAVRVVEDAGPDR
jgi:MGT family glycosyltransferase